MSKLKGRIFLVLIVLTSLNTIESQDLGDLMNNEVQNSDMEFIYKLHKDQYSDLIETRGISKPIIDKRSTNKKVTEFLVEKLNSYSKNVGLLVYAYDNGIFITLLLNNQGEISVKKKEISKDKLTEDVINFSESNSSSGLIRGSTAKSLDKNKHIVEIQNYIFPFKKEILNFDHLIIIPALNISNIPFASIKVSENKYLIDLMSYSIAPSFSELISSKNLNESRGIFSNTHEVVFNVENALFISNPEFSNDDSLKFSALPGTEIEVNNITSTLEESTYTILNGKEAKLSNFNDNICDYDLLYFATHGISDTKDPLNNSYLALTPDFDGNAKLTAKDVQDIRNKCLLKAELVILSACQTGLGKEHEAGTIGLTRAFHLAGSNHIVMSLWNVNDEKTAVLMSLFFKHLREPDKLMPHSAFRKAILEFKENNPNPNYWSSFSIFGIPY